MLNEPLLQNRFCAYRAESPFEADLHQSNFLPSFELLPCFFFQELFPVRFCLNFEFVNCEVAPSRSAPVAGEQRLRLELIQGPSHRLGRIVVGGFRKLFEHELQPHVGNDAIVDVRANANEVGQRCHPDSPALERKAGNAGFSLQFNAERLQMVESQLGLPDAQHEKFEIFHGEHHAPRDDFRGQPLEGDRSEGGGTDYVIHHF